MRVGEEDVDVEDGKELRMVDRGKGLAFGSQYMHTYQLLVVH